MMSDQDDGVEYLLAMKDAHGVGVVTVSDGSVFAFSAAALRELLARAEASDRKMATVFLKRSTPGDRS